jgi:hypothetical protein
MFNYYSAEKGMIQSNRSNFCRREGGGVEERFSVWYDLGEVSLAGFGESML